MPTKPPIFEPNNRAAMYMAVSPTWVYPPEGDGSIMPVEPVRTAVRAEKMARRATSRDVRYGFLSTSTPFSFEPMCHTKPVNTVPNAIPPNPTIEEGYPRMLGRISVTMLEMTAKIEILLPVLLYPFKMDVPAQRMIASEANENVRNNAKFTLSGLARETASKKLDIPTDFSIVLI